jgi:hypothetical protein
MNGHTSFIAWLSAIIAMALSGLGYLHGNFMTLREKDDVIRRLDRIDGKLDNLLEWRQDEPPQRGR